jgi:hypothetical protein
VQGTGNKKRALKLAYLEKTGPKMANMSKKKLNKNPDRCID